jgi:glucosyl-3-phosphoglycerate phosphatase
MALAGRIFIARHGETVFNAASRMQGQLNVHTPLTRAGFAQADAMGMSLVKYLDVQQPLSLWSSAAGRALQTLAIVAEHIGSDWHKTSVDDRLREIDVGVWGGRTYSEVIASEGEILNRDLGLFVKTPQGGETYVDVAKRLAAWIEDSAESKFDRLVVMHGMSSRVLRGLLLGVSVEDGFGAPIASSLPQGTIVMVSNRSEKIIHLGDGV